MRGQRRGAYQRRPPPDLVEQAKENLGLGADAVSITDSLFDAAFRSLETVHVEHPARWAMVVKYWERMTALYEHIDEGGNAAGGGLIVARRPQSPDNGRDRDPQPRNQPGLATPEKYRP